MTAYAAASWLDPFGVVGSALFGVFLAVLIFETVVGWARDATDDDELED